MYKNPEVDLKLRYRKVLELGFLFAIVAITLLLLSFKRFEKEVKQTEKVTFEVQMADIPATQMQQKPQAPSKPTVPIESDDPDLADDVTIEDTDLDLFEEVPPAPEPPKIEEEEEEDIPAFLPIQDQPKLIGGQKSIYDHLEYPEMAIKAQVEGVVTILVLVGKTGLPEQVTVRKTSGNESLDLAAVEAVRKGARYTPAKQRGKNVKYRTSHRIVFSLEDIK